MGELDDFYDNVGQDLDSADARWATTTAAQANDTPTRSSPTPATTSDPVRAWSVSGGCNFMGISSSLDRLPPGCYASDITDHGPVLIKHQLHTDSLLDLPDSKSRAVIAEIEHFQTLRAAFKKRGLLFKRGVLLWGPPGSGKTSTLHLLMRLIIEEGGGIALLITNPHVAGMVMQLIRQIEPNRQIIGIMEDIDGLIQHYSIEEYLSLLDGEAQIDNVVFVATTNYPERLDKRLVDRPSRFDTVEYVGMPTAEARAFYLRHKEPDLPQETIDQMVDASEGMSIAHLRELIILTQCFGRTIEAAAERLTANRRRAPNSEKSPDKGTAGFSNNTTNILLKREAKRLYEQAGNSVLGYPPKQRSGL